MSLYKDLHVIKFVVYLQAVEMILANFNRYKEYEHKNFQGLNMLHTVFGVMFVLYNTFIGNLLIENKLIMYSLTTLLWFANWFTIVYTSFHFEDMTYEGTISIVIAALYIPVLVPSFLYIANFINNEH